MGNRSSVGSTSGGVCPVLAYGRTVSGIFGTDRSQGEDVGGVEWGFDLGKALAEETAKGSKWRNP